MAHDDFQFEPLPGLPSHLPEGEEILWQGRPSIWGFARDVIRINWVAGYFLFLIIWRAIANSDQGLSAVLQSAPAPDPFWNSDACCSDDRRVDTGGDNDLHNYE